MERLTASEMGRLSTEDFASANKLPVILVADNIRSLNNIGSLFRTCDAFATEQLWLCGISATPPNKEIHKTALGAEDSVKWRYFDTVTDAITELKSLGYIVLCVEQVKGGTMLNNLLTDPQSHYGLIVGNEVKGVTQEALDTCDGAVEIPQFGTKHSLNVSVAAGVVLWQMMVKLRL